MRRPRDVSSPLIELCPPLLAAALLLAGTAFVLFRTDAGQDWLGELQRGRHDAALRQRIDLLVEAICQGNPDACIPLAHPDRIQQYGTEGARIRMGLLSAIVRLGKLRPDQVRVDLISMPHGCRTAEVTLSLQLNGEWKRQKPGRWERIGGDWYMQS